MIKKLASYLTGAAASCAIVLTASAQPVAVQGPGGAGMGLMFGSPGSCQLLVPDSVADNSVSRLNFWQATDSFAYGAMRGANKPEGLALSLFSSGDKVGCKPWTELVEQTVSDIVFADSARLNVVTVGGGFSRSQAEIVGSDATTLTLAAGGDRPTGLSLFNDGVVIAMLDAGGVGSATRIDVIEQALDAAGAFAAPAAQVVAAPAPAPAPTPTQTPVIDPFEPSLRKLILVNIQGALNVKGCNVGTTDGIWGRRTANGIEQANRLLGLSLSRNSTNQEFERALPMMIDFQGRLCAAPKPSSSSS